VDATRAFDKAEQRVFQDDGVHYTALGNRLVAEAVLPAMTRAACGV